MEQVEQWADAVLEQVPSWIWDGERLPVPAEEIADTWFGLLVRDVADMGAAPGSPELEPGQTLSGLLLADRGEIWVNAEEARQWPPRRRFTIGHELGHWVMHRGGERALFCRSATVQPGEYPEQDAANVPDIEEEASVFAAALLMPAHLIRREYERDSDFERLCELFNCSGAAMGRRLHTVI